MSYSNVRTLIGIASEEDEQEWVALAESASWRQLWQKAKQTGHERAERQDIAWPETGIYGELGRPSPLRRFGRGGLRGAATRAGEAPNRRSRGSPHSQSLLLKGSVESASVRISAEISATPASIRSS